jgi:hypothetical protein
MIMIMIMNKPHWMQTGVTIVGSRRFQSVFFSYGRDTRSAVLGK